MHVKVPMEGIGGSWVLNPEDQTLANKRSGQRYQLGDRVMVRLLDVNISARSTTAVLIRT